MDVPLALRQEHVSDDGHADCSPLSVREVHAPDADGGSDAHQMRPGQQSAFGDRAEVVDLQFDRSEAPRAIEVTVQGGAHGRVGDARGNAAMQRALAVEQLGPDAAPDGDAIAMQAHQFEPQQMIERVPGEKFLDQFGAALGVAQVW